MYYNRKLEKIEEEIEYKSKYLNFLYNTVFGRILLKLIVANPWFSKLKSIYQNSSRSKKDIKPFIDKYKIKINNPGQFNSFNDFFIRQKNIEIDKDKNSFISVADSKLSVYQITDDLILNIKNSKYSINDILINKYLSARYKNGLCLVFRLSVDDYHRYIYPDDGILVSNSIIKGKLHTVRPISEKYNVYAHNSREINVLSTNNFGIVTQIEVGALLVGKINNYKTSTFKKGQEKGYFEFGGSTIIVLLEENKLIIDEDIIKYNQQGIEVKVEAGEKIGIIKEKIKNV